MLNLLSWDKINNFSTVLLSIVLEGFPFIIIGTLVSSLIQVFVSEDIIRKFLPRNKFLGILLMALMGLVFPVCECGIVPVVRRLIKKGVPLNMAVTFMVAAPIINPVVLTSTYYAFLAQPIMVVLRASLGIISAVLIGYLIGELHRGPALKSQLIKYKTSVVSGHKSHEHTHDLNCECGHSHEEHEGKFAEVINHANHELYDIGRFFLIGAILSSIMQTYVPVEYILAIGRGNVSSILTMMCLAFLLSICSETDAFIARTFVGQFTRGSIIAFLIFGPMIDIKNTIMLTSSFNLRFVAKVIFIIFSICFIISALSNLIPSFL